MKHKGSFKQHKGITLVALVITIIILLILAGVSLGLLFNNGIIEKSKLAKQEYENAQLEESASLDNAFNTIDSIASAREQSSLTNYSTDEQVIGTWIDGKPLYRKTVLVTMETNWNVIYDLSLLNIEFVHKISGIIEYIKNSKYLDINFYSNSSAEWSMVYVTTDCKSLSSGCGSNISGKTAYVTLEYTKTTDTPTNN